MVRDIAVILPLVETRSKVLSLSLSLSLTLRLHYVKGRVVETEHRLLDLVIGFDRV